jgi:gamma-glutamylcyclotransferase (GGCT)/AIG2-like uncharacterized protein YtfP
VHRLFVYGTLLPGRLRWPLLRPFVTDHGPASVPGRLFDSGRGWPVAVFEAAADGAPDVDAAPTLHRGGPASAPGPRVPGVVVLLDPDRSGEAVDLLDRVEGTAAGLLDRVRVTTVAGEVAWAYHHPHAVTGLVALRSWAEVPLDAER